MCVREILKKLYFKKGTLMNNENTVDYVECTVAIFFIPGCKRKIPIKIAGICLYYFRRQLDTLENLYTDHNVKEMPVRKFVKDKRIAVDYHYSSEDVGQKTNRARLFEPAIEI